MAQSNGGHRSEYDIDNEYEQETESAKTSAPPSAPVAVPKPSTDAFRPRNLPTPAIYIPTLGGRRRDRRHAEDHIRGLQLANRVAGAAEVLEQGITKVVEAGQQREMAEQRRAQIPAKIEEENLELGERVLQRRAAFAAAARQQQDEGVKHERLQQIKTEDFETTLHNKRADRLQAEARERAAEAYLAHAEEIGKRKAEADFHKADEAAFEKEANAEAQRRRRDQERDKRGQAAADPTEEVPADLRSAQSGPHGCEKSRMGGPRNRQDQRGGRGPALVPGAARKDRPTRGCPCGRRILDPPPRGE